MLSLYQTGNRLSIFAPRPGHGVQAVQPISREITFLKWRVSFIEIIWKIAYAIKT